MNKSFFYKACCLVIATCLLLTMFCGCKKQVLGTDETYGIEYTGKVEDSNFALLYNTLGYEQDGTKKAYVRSVEYVNPADVGNNSLWTLLDMDNQVVAQGELTYVGLSFGLQLWEAEFSDVKQIGTFRMVAELTDDSYNPVYQEVSSDFLIQNRIYSHNLILPLTIYNAQAREAPEELGGGYYDCNTAMGEAYSHGVFLNGLVQTYVLEMASLSNEERTGIEEAAARAFDYLVLVHDDKTGEFLHSDPRRYNADINQGYHNTYEALYGFAAYLWYFSDLDPERASKENYERASQSYDYLQRYISNDVAVENGYPYKEYLIPVCYYLYKYSGDAGWMDRAVNLIDEELNSFNFRTMYRRGSRSIPMFEGVYLFLTDDEPVAYKDAWLEKLMEIKDTYFADLHDKNAMEIFPISDVIMAKQEWDDMWRLPAGEYTDKNWQLTTARAANALDACFLGELTGDASLERVAAASIGYILGLNPGFDGSLVMNPTSTRKISVGALVQNINGRYVRGWSYWGFTPTNNDWASVMNGFCMEDGDYAFKDDNNNDWIYGETFLRHDGAFAYALCVYERYVNAIGD